jgi:hypothetical protein
MSSATANVSIGHPKHQSTLIKKSPAYGELDPRFQQDIWVRPKPPGDSSLTIELLWWAAAAGQYGDGEEFPIFILRHRNAARCPSGVRCATSHWKLIADDLPAMEKGCIELQLVCLSTRHIELQMSSMNNGYFYDDRDLITIPPCRLHNDLLPDFSSVRAAGYQVVLFRLIESWEDKRRTGVVYGGIWMDNHGRLLFDINRYCGNTLEMHTGDCHTKLYIRGR